MSVIYDTSYLHPKSYGADGPVPPGHVHHSVFKKYKWGLIINAALCILFLIIAVIFIVLFSLVRDGNGESPWEEKRRPPVFASSQAKSPPVESSPTTNVFTWPPPSSSALSSFNQGAVASDHGLCSEIGRNMMIAGGNAVDAIVATAICQGAVNPQNSGLGGGAFITMYDRATRTCTVIDAREVAPGAATSSMYVNKTGSSLDGYLAIGVPGELHGLWTAHQQGGRLPWGDLLEPSIKLCQNGFPVSGYLAGAIKAQEDEGNVLTAASGLALFINPATKKGYVEGEIMKREVYADTLTALALADNPVDLFYNGSIAKQIVREIRNGGGIITEKDLRDYRSIKRQNPVVAKIANTELSMCGPPPPSSSVLVASILNVLGEFYKPNELYQQNNVFTVAQMFHRMLETYKFAFAERTRFGDYLDVEKIVQNLTSANWVDRIRSKIQKKAQDASYYGGDYRIPEDHGTSPMAAIDSKGNAVSLITSMNTFFGSRRRSKSTGIIFNNQMDDFSTPGLVNIYGFAPSPANFIAPGRRPLSSMSPVLFMNDNTGDVELALGAEGGSKIITAVASVAARILFFDETIKEAIDAPRIHNQLYPTHTVNEAAFPKAFGDTYVQWQTRCVSINRVGFILPINKRFSLV